MHEDLHIDETEEGVGPLHMRPYRHADGTPVTTIHYAGLIVQPAPKPLPRWHPFRVWRRLFRRAS